jgi:muconolactone delta-isomerase
MIKIIDWPQFLNCLLPILNVRARSLKDLKDGDCINLGNLDGRLRWVWQESTGWEISSKFGTPQNQEQEKLLTKLTLGYYDSIDISLTYCKRSIVIERLFPKKYPFIWDNNYLY